MASSVDDPTIIENLYENDGITLRARGYANMEIIVQDSLERKNESRRNSEFPSLSDKHIFNCFYGSGVTQGHVIELGTLLNISSDIMETLRDKYRNTAMFAVATVRHWLKNIARPNDIQYVYTELEDKLRQCHLNSVVGRLRRQETEMIDSLSVKDYIVEQTKTFNVDDAYLLGQKFGLDQESINEVIRECHATKGQQAAIAVYVEIERRNTFVNHRFVEKVTDALLEVQNRNKPCNEEDASFSSSTNALFNNSLEEVQKEEGIQMEEGERTVQAGRWQWIKNLIFQKIFAIFIFIVSILLIVMLILLVVLPVLPEFPNQVIFQRTVVEYYLPIDSYWIDTLDLQLLGPTQCSVEAVSVECDNIQFKTLADEELSLTSKDYLYFVEGSIITFSKRTDVHCQYCTPYYIWVFTSQTEADKHAKDDFDHLSCANAPNGASCIKINDSSPHVDMLVTQSSYHFIHCDKDPDCSLLANISITNNRRYNYKASKSKKIDFASFQKEELSQLKLKQQTFNPVSESFEDDVCILLQLEENCSAQDDDYHITVNGNRRLDLIFYPFIMILLLICLPTFVAVCIVCIIRWKRR